VGWRNGWRWAVAGGSTAASVTLHPLHPLQPPPLHSPHEGGEHLEGVAVHVPAPRHGRRFHPQLRDKNRRVIGKSQSMWTGAGVGVGVGARPRQYTGSSQSIQIEVPTSGTAVVCCAETGGMNEEVHPGRGGPDLPQERGVEHRVRLELPDAALRRNPPPQSRGASARHGGQPISVRTGHTTRERAPRRTANLSQNGPHHPRARATEDSQSQSERATPPASARHGGQPISVRTGRISCTGWLGGERGEGARECPPTMWVPPTPRATLPARICSPMTARAAATSAARHALPPGWRAAAAHSCAQDTTSVSDTLSSTSTMFLPASAASRYFLTRTDVT
jgi:hypothetical protein